MAQNSKTIRAHCNFAYANDNATQQKQGFGRLGAQTPLRLTLAPRGGDELGRTGEHSGSRYVLPFRSHHHTNTYPDVADIKQRITRNPSAYAQLPMQDVHRFNDRIHANEKADVTKTFETIRLYIKDREETYTALYKATRKCDEDAEKRKREKVFKALMEFDEGGMKPGGA